MWWWALLACADPKEDSTELRAVILVIDGVRPEECFEQGPHPLTGEPMEGFFPEVGALVPQGTLVRRGLQTLVSKTQPAHNTLMTGTHLPFGHFPLTESGANDVLELPSLFHAIGGPTQGGVLISSTSQVAPVARSLYPGASGSMTWVGMPDGDDGAVVREVARQLRENQPRLVVANLHEADRAGHDAEVPTDYTEVAKAVDAPIAALWQTIQSLDGYADRTVLVITADHGRHVEGVADGYTDHGDACAGCRSIPMFFIGPGVPAGVVAQDHAWDLVDVAPTVAALLGVSMPWADGLPIDEIVSATARAGMSERVAGAWVELGDRATGRGRVVVGGAVVSSAEAREARGPVVALEAEEDARQDAAAWCWRELLNPREGGPPGSWTARCVDRSGVELGWPEPAVSPFLRPGLTADNGEIVAFYEDNPDGLAWDNTDTIPLRLARHRGGWESAALGVSVSFPQWTTLVALGERRYLLAWTGADDGPSARDHRDLHLMPVSWPEGGAPEPGPRTRFANSSRHERPALHLQGATISAAWILEDLAGVRVQTSQSDDGGLSFTPAVTVSGESAIPVVQPIFSPDGTLYWAELVDGEARVMGLGAAGERVEHPLGVSRVESLAWDEGLVVIVDAGVARWEERRL